jgi:uncharacterized membrane protein YfcA
MGWMVFLLIGLGAGVLSGLFGIGGGVVIVPALIFIAKMQPQTATGTSLTALLLPVGAVGAWEYSRTGNLNLGAGLWIAVGLFVGAGIGARFSLQLPPAVLRRAFAVFLALIAARMWFAGDEARANAAAPPSADAPPSGR